MEAKENSSDAGIQQNIRPIMRSQSITAHANGGAPPLVPLKKRPVLKDLNCHIGTAMNLKKTDLCADTKKGRRKRPASDVGTHNAAGTTLAVPLKKRAALREVPNVLCDGVLSESSFPVPKAQTKVFREGNLVICKSTKEAKSPAGRNIPEFKNVDDLNLNRKGSKEDGDSSEKIFLEESSFGSRAFDADTINGVTSSSGIANIDCEKPNKRMCSIYASDIYSNFHANELIRRPTSDFLERLQTDVSQNMRAILINWLVEVCEEYCLIPDTLYLTVYLIDRYLSMNKIERQRLQLLGLTCLLIAFKYEEMCTPHVQELCFITDNSYRKNEAHAALMHLTNYLAELALLEYSVLKFLLSVIASGAVFLAQWTLDQSTHPWNNTLQHYTGYKSSDVKKCILRLRDFKSTPKIPFGVEFYTSIGRISFPLWHSLHHLSYLTTYSASGW